MAEPTLTDVFGAGATQTATTVTILKSDLDLTAVANNRAEQILAAIAKKASTNLTGTNFDANPDQSIRIEPGFDSIAYRNISNVQTPFLRNQLTFTFSKLQESSGITPNDY